MKRCRELVLAGALATCLTMPASGEPRAVLELFTSQGCSSCPPADRLLGELAKDSSIVALSLPVDYWDYLGWKDTLASPRNTAKQRAYSRARGDREIYTPQVVVNGVIPVLGSDRNDIEDAIAQTRKHAMTVAVQIAVSGDKLTVSVPAAQQGATNGEVWICGVTKAAPVAIGRGENSGRSITYFNVARRWIKVGDWDGKAASWTVSADTFLTQDADSAVAIVQSGNLEKPGLMIGASVASLR